MFVVFPLSIACTHDLSTWWVGISIFLCEVWKPGFHSGPFTLPPTLKLCSKYQMVLYFLFKSWNDLKLMMISPLYVHIFLLFLPAWLPSFLMFQGSFSFYFHWKNFI